MGASSSTEQTINITANQDVAYAVNITGLEAFTIYTITVVAATRIGLGEELSQFANTDPAASSPPTNFTVESTTSNSITLSWDYPETPRGSIEGYVVQYGTSSSLNGAIDQNITLEIRNDNRSQMYTAEGLLPFTEYYFVVRAYSFGFDLFVIHEGMESNVVGPIRTEEAGRYVVITVVSMYTLGFLQLHLSRESFPSLLLPIILEH
ncbi:MAG: hypothetical protein A6F71_10075 [Cycloclasticus sp. symbiont of Poecilosclerida sp. M]|nr:MAG: hypothetical protein A6F71_10075 [Cycloclasticus sp. symbiont of Poecilosclerida sp. M]